MARHTRESMPPKPRGLADWLRMFGGVVLAVAGAVWMLMMAGLLLFGFLGLTDFDPLATVEYGGLPTPEGAIVLVLGVAGWIAVSGGKHLYYSGRYSNRSTKL
ncbi:MAG: hypothetical protein ACKVI4_10260 [Actinomycetales bacterium]